MAVNIWELAGYSAINPGGIVKSIPSGRLLVPGKIWLEKGALRWELSPSSKLPPLDRGTPKTLLNDFVRLQNDASGERIVRFARINGVLWLKPASIDGSEPLETWRILSRKASALLNIGAALERGKRADPEDWKWVLGPTEEAYFQELRKPLASRSQLLIELRRWLNSANGLGFALAWDSTRRRFELEVDYGGQMLNAVAMQLALAIAKSDSLFICSGCGLPYSRSAKRPKSGQANFCNACSKEGLRQADTRRRVKMAEARRLYETGLAPSDVAVQLDVRGGAKTVRSWATKGKWHGK